MPKAKEMEYRDHTATAERTEYQDRTATAERTEFADEKTEYQDRTATAERVEFADEKTEDKTQYPAENRDNSYMAANQHMVKFADELRGINEQAALGFDRRKNPAEYELKEKHEMLEAVTEAFNATNWNSAIERRLAADDIAQNLYQPMYPRVEVAEAAVQHKLPSEFIQELKQEKIEYFERKHDQAGAEALSVTVKDMETAQRMVEQSNGMFHVVSTRNLDHYRDQFADALYSSDRHEGATGLMESSLDDAIRLYNGDVSHIKRWDETLDETATFSEQEAEHKGESGQRQAEEYEGGSDQQQAEGQLEPSDRESAAFHNLQSMDEYTLDHNIRDMLNEKLSHTQEYLTELQMNRNPDANAVAQVHEALYEMSHEGFKESVEKGDEENYARILRHIEGADQQLAMEMRERNGFIGGEDYVQPKPPESFTNLDEITGYADEVRKQINGLRDEMPQLTYDINDKLLERLDTQIQMVGEWDNPNLNSDTNHNQWEMERRTEALAYTTRAEDPVFWKLREMDKNELDSEIQIITENHAAEGIKDWLETNEDVEMRQRTLVGLDAMKENAMEDLTYAVKYQDHELYQKTLDQIDAKTGEYAEILGKQSGEIWVEEKLEHPAQFTEVKEESTIEDGSNGSATMEYEIKKLLYRKQAEEFANHYEQTIERAEGNSDAVMALADDLLQYYQAHLEELIERDFEQNFRHLDAAADIMTSLLKEKQPSV